MSGTSTAPPRLLIGVALLFWGFMTDRPVIGLSLALVMEAAHWTKLRWEFEEQSYLRAWQLSALLIGATMMLILIDGGRYVAVPRLLGWLPLLLAPMQFTQSYGLKDRMPLTTFSFFARRRMLRNLELGLPTRPIEVNFGAIYLPTTVVACTLGDQADSWWFLIGIVVITGWAALAIGRGRRLAIFLLLVLASGMTLAGQFGLKTLYSYLVKGSYGDEEESTISHYRTAIGSRGEVKQSSEILWRIKPLQGPAPQLLHTAIFNHYDRSTWAYRVPPEKLGTNTDFDDLKTKDAPGGIAYYLTNSGSGEESFAPELPRINLRGAVRMNSAIPVPGSVTALTGFDFDGTEANAIGTIRVFPRETIADGTMVWDGHSSPESPPWKDTWIGKGSYVPDLRVPPEESVAVQQIVNELNLKALPLEEKLATLKGWFASQFRYTRYLGIDSNRLSGSGQPSALSIFLTKHRAGHCEYFATATTLILREAGVPARYAIGYAVMEHDKNRQEYVVRGLHGHAWCRVWDEPNQRWIDFDTTPANWLAEESQRSPWYQGFLDWVQRSREDFFIWRNRPGNSLRIGALMTAIGLLGAGIIGRSLWRSRRRIETGHATYRWNGPLIRTPLHVLEPVAAKLLGPRPTGTPLGGWLKRLPAVEGLDEAINLHQQLRFDPGTERTSTEPRLTELVKQLRSAILEKARKRP